MTVTIPFCARFKGKGTAFIRNSPFDTVLFFTGNYLSCLNNMYLIKQLEPDWLHGNTLDEC